MKTLYLLTKLTVMLLIGILAGQVIFITFNTGLYFRGCEAPIQTSQEAPQAPTRPVQVIQEEYSEEDWLDHPASF